MKNIDNFNSNDFRDKREEINKKVTGSPETWLNENGYPNYEYLQSLVKEETPGALEKLRFIADDLDVDYHLDISSQELVEKIRLAVNKLEVD
ncbi:MAG TPA: hypothetical protein VFD51_03915 [Patescibacteria group bacterium]|nr:hypothetical protein [Patescibacteria group bacterium]